MSRAVFTLIAVLALAGVSPARAETQEIQGVSLVLDHGSSNDLVITTDASLAGHIRVTSDGPQSCLEITASPIAAHVRSTGCGDDLGTLRIAISPGAMLTLTNTGSGTMHLPDLFTPLSVTLNGSGDLVGGRAISLSLTMQGSGDASFAQVSGPTTLNMFSSGDVRLKQLNGTLILKHHASGDLAIGKIEAGPVEIDSTGSGDMLIGRGHIGMLHARMAGNGDLGIAAQIVTADVDATGGGDVKLGRVNNVLHRQSSGGSDIYIGGPDLIDTLVGKVAEKMGDASADDHSVTINAGTPAGFENVVTFGAVVLVGFLIFRMVQRRGGLATLAPRRAAAAVHPGVTTLGEIMARLDQRMSRMEGYVTTREFDLNQKFRDLK